MACVVVFGRHSKTKSGSSPGHFSRPNLATSSDFIQVPILHVFMHIIIYPKRAERYHKPGENITDENFSSFYIKEETLPFSKSLPDRLLRPAIALLPPIELQPPSPRPNVLLSRSNADAGAVAFDVSVA